jgi:DNA invertase Pin-like site-specific DNA recombinase
VRILRETARPELAIKFLRVSDAPTQSPENSLEGQDWGIEEGIVKNPSHPLFGIKVIKTFRLLHASHRGLKGVDIFDEMIRWAREGRFKYILVDKYDRFGRNLREAITVEDELNKFGVYIVSAKEQFDQRQPAGWLAKTLMQMLADFYSRNLATETRKGMRAKLDRGEWPWAAPLGYRHPTRRTERGRAVSVLEEDPEAGPRIRWAWEEFATGKYTRMNGRLRGTHAKPQSRSVNTLFGRNGMPTSATDFMWGRC